MKRGWLGVAILLIFLALGFMTAEAMENAHRPTQVLLEQAANATLSGEFGRGVALGMEAKSRWERHWNGTAAVADHSPMDDVDALFAEMEHNESRKKFTSPKFSPDRSVLAAGGQTRKFFFFFLDLGIVAGAFKMNSDRWPQVFRHIRDILIKTDIGCKFIIFFGIDKKKIPKTWIFDLTDIYSTFSSLLFSSLLASN